jgi:hypothetical protein
MLGVDNIQDMVLVNILLDAQTDEKHNVLVGRGGTVLEERR